MGREVRKVPPNWQHPLDERGNPQPMNDEEFSTAARRWKNEFSKWEAGERPDYADSEDGLLEFWEWDGGPPDRKYYRPWTDADATWFQLWETVSEGTPVSPPFATKAELDAYLAEHGDFWDRRRGRGGWGREVADAFLELGFAPSGMVVDGRVVEGRDVPSHLKLKRAET